MGLLLRSAYAGRRGAIRHTFKALALPADLLSRLMDVGRNGRNSRGRLLALFSGLNHNCEAQHTHKERPANLPRRSEQKIQPGGKAPRALLHFSSRGTILALTLSSS